MLRIFAEFRYSSTSSQTAQVMVQERDYGRALRGCIQGHFVGVAGLYDGVEEAVVWPNLYSPQMIKD